MRLFSHSCYQVLKGSSWRVKGRFMANIHLGLNFSTLKILGSMDIKISDKNQH